MTQTLTGPAALTRLTEDEALFRDSVYEFADKEIRPLSREMDEQAKMSRELVDKLFELGIMGIEVPESHAGAGATFFHSVLAVESLSRVDPAVDLVLVDRVQVQQVVLNLVRNGVDSLAAFDGPSRELEVRIEPDGDVAKVSVTDNGPGIDPEIADRLFQPFITTKRTGMGVGLSISRTIIEAHGGRIWAEGAEPVGARFSFTLQTVNRKELEGGE